MGERKDNPINPQRLAFKENYLNPESETFGNIQSSAIKAGYSESYAEHIMSESIGNAWVKEIVRDYQMTGKAEEVLDDMLKMSTSNTIEKGEELYVKTDTGLVKIKQDTAKFIVERLKKDKWSARNEHTGAGGKDLIPDDATQARVNEALDNYFKNAKPN